MKTKNVKLEWNVLLAASNTNKIINYNVLDKELVEILHKEIVKKKTITKFEQLKETVNNWCKYYYWSRCEYEIGVGGAFAKYPDEYEKIDAYRQIEMNLDRICEYIIKELKIEF